MNRRSGVLVESAQRHRAWLLGLALLAGLLAQAAEACQVCIPMPVKTLADRLLEADALVLAREDPERPFHYGTVEILKGDPGDTPIDAFLPSMNRRMLARYPERHMLLARERDGDWTAMGIADADYERVVRRILDHSATWRPMETDNPQRLEELAPLLGHADLRLHELAYLEIGRAPYATIRRISAEVSIETVRDMLDDPRYLEWRSLAILMLAQSRRPADRARIVKTFADKQRSGSTLNLGAWATAFLAIEGPDAIGQVRRWYLERPDRSRAQLREVVNALSVHAGDDPSWREPVVTAYRALLDVHPALAPAIARDLIAWHRWELVEQIRGIRKALAETDPLGAYLLGLYLHRAAGATAQPVRGETGPASAGAER